MSEPDPPPEEKAPPSEPFADTVRRLRGSLLPRIRDKRTVTRSILDALRDASPFGGASHAPRPRGPNSSRS